MGYKFTIMIYAIGFVAAWFIVVAWHAYLQYKEDIEEDEELRLYREYVYQPMWASSIDPYRVSDDDIAADISLLKRTDSGLLTYFKPTYTNYTDNFGMIMPLGAYHKPGKWETHHLGSIDLHWHRGIAKRVALPVDAIWPVSIELKDGITERLKLIHDAEEQIKKQLGISTERDGKTRDNNTEV